MKKLLMILTACLMPYVAQAFPTNINSKTIDISKLKNDFRDFKFNLKGFDSQHFTFTFNNNGANDSITSLSFAFKASQRRGSSNLVFISIANSEITKATNTIDFGFAATNVPPDGTYKAEILAFEGANTNLSRSFGRGTLVVLESLYDDVDGTFPFPGTITNLLDFLTITSAVATFYPLSNPSNFSSSVATTTGLASVSLVVAATNQNFINLTNEIRIATNAAVLDAAALDVLTTNGLSADLTAVIVASTNQNFIDLTNQIRIATNALDLVNVNTNFLVAAGTGLLGGGHMSGTNVTLRLDPAVTSSLVVLPESDPNFATFTNTGGEINGELRILSDADLIFKRGSGTNVPAIIFDVERGHISMNTVDGSDSNILTMVGGGPDGSKPTRGGSIDLIGNEGALSGAPGGGGTVYIQAGNVAGALIALADQNNLDSIIVSNGLVFFKTSVLMSAGITWDTSNVFSLATQDKPLTDIFIDNALNIDGIPISRSGGNLTYLGSNLVFEAIFILATNALDLTLVSTGVVLTAGTGLDGGGPLTNGLTFSLEATATNTFLITATFVSVTNTIFQQKVDTNVTVTAGTGLLGGGKLTNNVTLNLDPLVTNGLATEIFVTNTALLRTEETNLSPFRLEFRMVFSDGNTNWTEFSLGANNTFLKSQGPNNPPVFELFAAITTNTLLGDLADNPVNLTFIMAKTNLTDNFYSNVTAAIMRTNLGLNIGVDITAFDADLDALATNNGAGLNFVNAATLSGIAAAGFLQDNEVGALTTQGAVTNDSVTRDVMIASDAGTNFFWGSVATDIPTNVHDAALLVLSSDDGTNLYWKVDSAILITATNSLDEVLDEGNNSSRDISVGGITNTGIFIQNGQVTQTNENSSLAVDVLTVKHAGKILGNGSFSLFVNTSAGNDTGIVTIAAASLADVNRTAIITLKTTDDAAGGDLTLTSSTNGAILFAPEGLTKLTIDGSFITIQSGIQIVNLGDDANWGGNKLTNMADAVSTNSAITLQQLITATNDLPVRTAIRVNSSNDLPAESGGVHTLLANTTYLIDGTVVLTAPAVFSNGTMLVGQNVSVDIWAYQGAETALIASNNNAIMRNFTLSAASGRGFVCASTDMSHQVEMREMVLSVVNVAQVGPMDLFSMSRCQWSAVTGTGVVFIGISSNQFITIVDNDFTTVGDAMGAFDFNSTEVHDVTFARNIFRHTNSAFSISGALASSNIVNSGFAKVNANVFHSNALENITKKDKSWIFLANQNISDSTIGGEMYMTNIGTAVVVIEDVPTNVLTDAYFGVDEERIDIGTNGVITINTLLSEQLIVFVTVEMAPASGNDKVLRAHLVIDDVLQPLNNGKVTASVNDPVQATIVARVELAAGATLRVAVENTTDGIDIVVDKITVTVFR